MNLTNADKGKILAKISDVETVIDVINVFAALAESVETNRILSKDLGAARADIALARDENAALRQRIAELEAAAIFGPEAPTDD